MNKKLLYFVRSLIYSIQNNYNIVFFNQKKGSSFKIWPYRLLFAILLVLFSVNFAGAQTTTLFQFNFEGTTAWTTENVTGTPTFASSGIVVNPYDTSSPCQGSSMYSARSWSVGDYYRFVVNTSGHSNLKFSFCSRTSSVSIGEFLVRVSSDSGANWTVVDDFTPTTSNLTLETGIFPESANNTGTVWIEIYKSVNGGDNGRSFIIDNATLTSYAIPTITSFTGSPVCSGSTPSVVITGTNLTGATAVNFNGLAASSFIVNSNTQITASLPSTASTGYITVTTPGGTAGSANAFVVNPPPTVTSTASPTSVISGGASTLTASVTEKTILLQEGFNGATNTWTKATTGSSGGTIANAAWTLKPAGYYYYYDNPYPGYQFTSNDNSQFYLSNSAAQGSAGNTNTQLISPPMNTIGYTSLSLEFYQFYLNFTDNTDESYVEVSTTGGAPWTIVRTNGATQGAQNNFFKTIVNLDDYINAATLYVRFRYVARFDWFWAIDNVTISGDKTITCNYTWAAIPSVTLGLPAGAGTAVSTNKSIVVNPTQTTNYTVTATNISTGCTATATPVQVAILAPTLTSFTPTLSCSGLNTSVVITGTNFTGASDVSFNGVSAVFTVNSNTQITATLPATATSGAISVTTAGGTVHSASSFIVNTPSLAPTGITGTTIICNGTQTTLTAAGGTLGTGANYQWGTGSVVGTSPIAGQTGSTLTITPTSSTTYWVRIVNTASPCTVSTGGVTQLVTVNAPSVAPTGITGTTIICNGTQTTLTAAGGTLGTGANYQWGTGSVVGTSAIAGQTGSTLTITPTSSTTYWVRIVNTTSPCTVSTGGVNQLVTVNAPSVAPTGITGTTIICNGTQTTLTAAGGTLGTGANYQWGTGSVVGTSPIAGQTGSTLTITPTSSTTYWVRIVNTASPCTVSTGGVTQLVTVNTPSVAPTGITGITTICNGTQTTLTAAGGTLGTGANYQWGIGSAVGTNPIAGETGSTLAVSPTSSTTYWVRIINTTSPCTVTTGGVTQLVTVNTPSVAPTGITGTTTICNGTQTILTAAGGTLGTGANYQWGIGSVVGTSPIAGETGSTLTITPTISTTYWVRIINTTSPCTVTTGGVTQLVTVNQISGDPTSASVGSASICIGGSTTLTLNGGGGGTGEIVKWYTTSCGGTPAGTGNGLSVNPTVTTTYYGRYENGTPCNYVSNCATVTVTVTALPTIPTITITQPTCTVLTGTITVTSPAPGTGFTYSIDGIDYTNTTGIFTVNQNTTYNVTTQNASECISPARSAIVNASSDRVWNGSIDKDWTNPANWTPNIVPTSTDCVVIPLTAKKPEIAAGTSVAIHSVTVDNAAILTVKSKAILTVATGITVATGGDLIFEDDSSLLQTSTDNTINSGNITYKRITSDVRRYDFTCWSSPIHSTPAFTLHDVSPLTLADKYYSFNPSTGWIISYGGVLPMQQGMGYIVRAPQTYDITTPAPYEASFVGTPNNGRIEITPEANKNILVGNPYPSALDAKKFINENTAQGVDVGSLYFWTHNSPPVNSIPGDKKYHYNTADYAVFNLTGSTASSTNGNNQAPTGFIAAAASFFIKPNRSANIVFTNSMRVGAGNDQFYKTAKADNEGKNRLWLNFANTEGAFKQVLIGYLDGATDEKDYNYDGPTISGNAYVDFYSINNTDKLTIQGRALPFDDSDLVPLGYVSKIVGDFTISIDKADGFFDTQAVYLEDKNTGKITDLRAENYTFATEKGTFQDRFVLRYTNKTLGTGDFENIENGLLVAVKDKAIKITSAKEAIKEVTIFDINGKLLYDKKKIGSTELQIANLQAANQVLLVKVILENGFTTTKKIVFQ